MPGCLKPHTLVAFAAEQLTPAETESVVAHLERCRRCAEALARLSTHDDLLSAVRELQQWRRELDAEAPALRELETHLSTTLFGKA